MALRTVSNTGGNWSSTTAWVGGVVPIAGDTVDFTATSGNLTVNTNTANLAGIDFTNYVNTITITNIINISNGITNLGTGGYTQLGANGLVFLGASNTIISNGTVWSRTLTFSTNSSTITLSDNLYVTGNILFQSAATYNLSGNSLYVGGNLTMAANGVLGTTTIIFNGTGTWTNTGATAGIKNNLTINTLGTLTISGTVYYNTGTLTYTSGTVVTTGSTLNISGSATLNTNGIIWASITFPGVTSTITLTSDLTAIGTIDFPNASVTTTINGSILKIGASLIHRNANSITGTTLFLFNGTGTFNGITTGAGITNSITVDTAGTLSLVGNIIILGGTFTYISGTVNTGTSILFVYGTVTLNTNGINFYRITSNNSSTLTLTSNLTATNSVSLGTSGNITINGSAFYIGGSLSIVNNVIISGTTNIILNGTGTWSVNLVGIVRNNLTIDTLGTITVSGTVYYNTGTLTYITGTVITTSSLLFIQANTTIATGVLSWNNVFIGIQNAGSTIVITLNDSFTIGGSLQVNGTLSFIPNTYLLRVDGDLILGYYAGGTYFNVTLTIPNDLIVRNLNYSVFGINTTVNGFSITILGNLSTANTGGATVGGSTNLILGGTGSWSQTSIAPLTNNLTINTSGTITIIGNVYYNTGRFTFVNGKVITKNSTLNLTATCTLINCHKINFDKVIITSGVIITMNEFFNGSPALVTTITSSSTTNYTITFQDGFEKITKFTNISGCALSKPMQLLSLTNIIKKSANTRGIRYINQSPNGIAKNKPSLQNSTTFGVGGLVGDPNM